MAAQTKSLDLELSSSQYASITDASQSGLDITGDITIEAMIKLEQLPITPATNFTIVSKYLTTGNQRSYILDIDTTNKLHIIYSDNGEYTSHNTEASTTSALFTSSDIGIWIHISVTIDVSTQTIKMYRNGREISVTNTASNASSIFNGTSIFGVGVRGNLDNFFDGKLKNVRVWSDVRTQKEIIQFMGTSAVGETGLVSEWQFEDDYIDSQGSNDLTASGSPVFASDVPNTIGIKDVANWTLLEKINVDISSLSLSADLDLYPINVTSLLSATFTGLESDAKDLRFTTDEAGLYEVPYELVLFNQAGETIQVWVLLPTLTYDASFTALYVWGTNSGATGYASTDIMGGQSVWRSEYKGVWHLEEASGTRADSTANANNLADNNTVTQGTGKIGNGADFESSNTEYLSITDASQTGLDITSDFSFSSWLSIESSLGVGVEAHIGNKKNIGVDNGGWFSRYRNSGGTYQFTMTLYTSAGANDAFTLNYTLTPGTLYHFAFTWDSSTSTARFFINGVQQGSDQTGTITSIGNTPNPFQIGVRNNAGTPTSSWDGIMDEFRIFAEYISADWIKADYSLQNSPATYITNTAISGGNFFLMF